MGQEPSWSVYFKHLLGALGWGGMLAVLGGLALTVVNDARRSSGTRAALLAVFPLAYYLFLSRQGLVFGRYLLPLAPFVALLFAVGVLGLTDLLRTVGWPRLARRAAVVGLVAVLLVGPARASVNFNRRITQPSTQAEAYQWILRHLPRGANIVSERFEVRLSERMFRVELELRLSDRTYDDYVRSGVEYLVASSYVFGPVLTSPEANPARAEAYHALFSRAREVFRIAPGNGVSGPEIRIYAIPDALK